MWGSQSLSGPDAPDESVGTHQRWCVLTDEGLQMLLKRWCLKIKALDRHSLFTIYHRISPFILSPAPLCDCSWYAGWRCCCQISYNSTVTRYTDYIQNSLNRRFWTQRDSTWIWLISHKCFSSHSAYDLWMIKPHQHSLNKWTSVFFTCSQQSASFWTSLSASVCQSQELCEHIWTTSKLLRFYHSGGLQSKSFQVFLSLHPQTFLCLSRP